VKGRDKVSEEERGGWLKEIEELAYRKELARQMGGAESIERQHSAGRYTCRERIAKLLDPGTFCELGSITGVATYEGNKISEFRPANFVMGTGKINGRKVVVGADDFTIRGGAADAGIRGKREYSERMALELKLPIIRLIDGTGGGGSVKTIEMIGRTYVPANPAVDIMVELLSTVPVISGVMGSVAGLGAARAVFSHFSVMPKNTAQLFVAGPPVVEAAFGMPISKEELGGSQIHTTGFGAVDNEAESEEDAFKQMRKFLSYLPDSVYEMPPCLTPTDPPDRREEDLLHIIPHDLKRPYRIRKILSLVLDKDSFFEIGFRHGKPVVTGLARLSGKPIGVLASDPMHYGGAITAQAADKMVRFIDLCDTFHLPVVNFVDIPGFMIGPQAEREATIRFGARYMFAVCQATVPWCSIILGRVFGVAGANHGNTGRLNLRYAWPSGRWGSLPIEGGVKAAYRRQIESAPDPEATEREIAERLNKLSSPFRSAEVFSIEEIIDPRDTRTLLCDWVNTAYRLLPHELGPKKRGMRP